MMIASATALMMEQKSRLQHAAGFLFAAPMSRAAL